MVRFNLVHFVVLPVTQRLVARNITESQVNPSLEILKQKMQIMRGCVHAGTCLKPPNRISQAPTAKSPFIFGVFY